MNRLTKWLVSIIMVVGIVPMPQAKAMTSSLFHQGVEKTCPLLFLAIDHLKWNAKEKMKKNGPDARDMAIETEQNKEVRGNLIGYQTILGKRSFTIEENGAKGKARVLDQNTGEFLYQTFADDTGTDTFTYRVEDLFGHYDIAEVTVTINLPNNAPVAKDLSVHASKDKPASSRLLADDPDGDTFTFSIEVLPEKGAVTITDPRTGAFTYTPDQGATGKDRFKFSVFDGKARSNWGTVTIEITE
jgi:hypothetical protein